MVVVMVVMVVLVSQFRYCLYKTTYPTQMYSFNNKNATRRSGPKLHNEAHKIPLGVVTNLQHKQVPTIYFLLDLVKIIKNSKDLLLLIEIFSV